MDFTVLCPNCGAKLHLFDSQVKRRKGTLRCTRCGCRIPYDLSQPRPVRTGFWPETEAPFKPGAQKKFLSLAKAHQQHPDFQLKPLSEGRLAETELSGLRGSASRVPPAFDRSQSSFKAFDLKTGRVLDEAAPLSRTPVPKPVRPAPPAGGRPRSPPSRGTRCAPRGLPQPGPSGAPASSPGSARSSCGSSGNEHAKTPVSPRGERAFFHAVTPRRCGSGGLYSFGSTGGCSTGSDDAGAISPALSLSRLAQSSARR